ncbi:hypothetical protein N7539_003094 [Penicillium diatomitis]|uniref:Sulfotransferase family protein n=1 Tax=Penicillium diatomitis TaxID=2819901 RepID=A0A9W9XH56_9EURO|nr:uncharacterized protein N7539_003094 [Penicillium diatomitis]KAJ5491527.1 hypothetical protein N7539_003094 [Penicillium diatomitis]
MNDKPSSSDSPRGVFLVSYARTASNLLCKILALDEQPRAFSNPSSGYYFRPAFLPHWVTGKPYRPIGEISAKETQERQECFQRSYEDLERDAHSAREQGKIHFFKEHALWISNPAAIAEWMGEPNLHPPAVFRVHPVGDSELEKAPSSTWSPENQTVMSDQVLQKWRLVFLVRHPALAFPSYYRASLAVRSHQGLHDSEMEPLLRASLTLRWSRFLYDWACKTDPHPLMLDADDVILNKAALAQFCTDIGLDATRLRFQWESRADTGAQEGNPPPKQEQQTKDEDEHKEKSKTPFHKIFGSTLLKSSGVMKTKSQSDLDIATEAAKWKSEFGVDMADLIEKCVRDAMPDYEYLHAKRSYANLAGENV